MRNKHITAEIIADSIAPTGERLTSFIVVVPRIVLAEFNTHRALTRNSASSRAIPFDKMLEKVISTPFIPIKWQKDHSGMQGSQYLKGRDVELADGAWLRARDRAVEEAKMLNHNIGVTKQFCNRLLEPFLYHTIITTASEWQNFLALRAHSAAEIHIQDLAFKMLEIYNESIPNPLSEGEWHIPFGDKMDLYKIANLSKTGYIEEVSRLKVKIAVARCARVSYLNYEGTDDYEKDIILHDRLADMGHWSPFEHCARVMTSQEYQNHIQGIASHNDEKYGNPIFQKESMGWSGNFKGFIQYRKTFKGENKNDERVVVK